MIIYYDKWDRNQTVLIEASLGFCLAVNLITAYIVLQSLFAIDRQSRYIKRLLTAVPVDVVQSNDDLQRSLLPSFVVGLFFFGSFFVCFTDFA